MQLRQKDDLHNAGEKLLKNSHWTQVRIGLKYTGWWWDNKGVGETTADVAFTEQTDNTIRRVMTKHGLDTGITRIQPWKGVRYKLGQQGRRSYEKKGKQKSKYENSKR